MKYILITFCLFFQLAWASVDKELNTGTLDILFHKPSQTKYLGEDLCARYDTEEYLCLPDAVSKISYEVVDSVPQDVWEAFREQVSQVDYRESIIPGETLDILFHKPSQTKYLGEGLCARYDVRHDTEEYFCLPGAISKSSYEVMDSVPQDVWEAFQKQISALDYRVTEH